MKIALILLGLPLIGITLIKINNIELSVYKKIGEEEKEEERKRKRRRKKERKDTIISLVVSIINLIIIIIGILKYDKNVGNYQYQLTIGGKILGGKDGISLWLILLVNIIIPIVILDSWKTIKGERKRYIILVLLVNILSIAVFYVLDILLFFISFEAILIPKYYLIGFYGSRNKKIEEAQNKFFIYTLVGSLFLLIALLTIYLQTGTTDYQLILTLPISERYQIWLFIAFFIAFAIKTPKWPFHIWLPVAHGESSTGTSVILAAILLKLGSYGFIRYSLPLFPYGSEYFVPLILTLALISIIYSCISALSLLDIKSIIAYSSIAHMNVGVIGIFSNDLHGLSGAYLYSISHGFASAALFLLAGHLYDRYHTKTLKYFRGLVIIMPIYITLLFLFSLSNLSFPLTLGFIAEFLILQNTLQLSPLVTLLTVAVTFLLPFYFIWTFQRISFGFISSYYPLLFQDTTIKEFHLLFPLLFLTIIFGIFPNLILNSVLLPLFHLLY